MALSTSTLITDTQATLAAAFPELAVELFPDQPANYRLNHPTGALLLAYPGSTLDSPMLMGRVEQARTIRIGITLVLRNLWGDDGAAGMLDRLRDALIGWRHSSECEPVYAVNDRLLQHDGGLWWYAAEFGCVTRLILPIR